MHEKTLEKKLRNIIREDNPTYMTKDGKKHYISRKKLNDIKEAETKKGGILPLLTLLPLIFGGIGAAGAVAGGAAGIAKSVNDKKSSDAELAEEERHNKEMEKAVGRGLKDQIKNFVEKTGLEQDAKKSVKKIIKALADTITVVPETNGDGLYLNPTGSGLNLDPYQK